MSWEHDLARREAEIRGAGYENLYASIIRTNHTQQCRRFLEDTILFLAGAIAGVLLALVLIMAGAL